MVTITLNERTKAGKALLATARLLAEHSKGIVFEDDATEDRAMGELMKSQKTGETVSRASVMKELRKR